MPSGCSNGKFRQNVLYENEYIRVRVLNLGTYEYYDLSFVALAVERCLCSLTCVLPSHHNLSVSSPNILALSTNSKKIQRNSFPLIFWLVFSN